MSALPVRWRAHGISGAAYRACSWIYTKPQQHPRLMHLLFHSLMDGVHVIESRTGCNLRVDVDDYIATELLNNGGYESASLTLALDLIQPGDAFVDIGANIGLYSLPISSLPNVTVISVDGSVPALSRLWQNSELNKTKPLIVAALVAREHRLVSLSLPCPTNLGGARLSTTALDGPALNCSATITLDDVISLAASRPVRLMKIDAEGTEYEVISSFDWSKQYRPQHILIELWPDNSGAHKTFDMLRDAGYVAKTIYGKTLESLEVVPEDNVWFTDANGGAQVVP